MAPKIQADLVRWSLGALGRVPRFAQRRVILVRRANDSPDHLLLLLTLSDPVRHAYAAPLGPRSRLTVLPPDLYVGIAREPGADFRHFGGEVFLKLATANAFWAGWRGRAVILTKPSAFNARLTVLWSLARRWPSWWNRVRFQRSMAWCAGGWSIWRNGCGMNTASRWTKAR